MLKTISHIESLLEQGKVGLPEILALRRELQAPFKLHPLGFIACTLLTEGSRKLRLHYWPLTGTVQQSPDCQIHDHLFEFTSWVIAGEIVNVEYKLSQSGQEFAEYRVEYSGDQSILTKTPNVIKLTEHNRSLYKEGSTYSVRSGVLHETQRTGLQKACTILLTNDVSESSPLVLGPVSGLAQYVYQRSNIDEAVVEQLLF